jgi:hypothetical protein
MTTVLVPASTGEMLSSGERLRIAVAAFLARYTGLSRQHTASDLRGFLDWCAERGLDPLVASRPQLELFVRWMQETRRLKPSTVSRRTSVVAGFYRTCVIDGVLDHSPAEHLRRPRVPPESPTLGLTHLQFEALLTAARDSSNHNDFALVAMLGLLGCGCSKRAAPMSLIWGRSTATASCGWSTRAARSSSSPSPGGWTGDRPRHRRTPRGADPADSSRIPDGPARGHPTPATPRRGVGDADAPAATRTCFGTRSFNATPTPESPSTCSKSSWITPR